MNGYKRVKEGVFRLEIKRSEFIAYTYAAESEEEAKRRLADVRQAHREARHVCFAYVCGADGGIVRFSDDGEPGGTAGKPILDVLQKNALKNSLIAVVRYFGGIKLGIPGLIRAYRTSAADALDHAEIIEKTATERYRLTFGYMDMNGVMKILKDLGLSACRQDFGMSCSLETDVRLTAVPLFTEMIEKTGGCTLELIDNT